MSLTEVKYLPDAAVPGCLCDRASRLCGDRSAAAGTRLARLLPVHDSCSAGTPTAATAWPDPSRDPRLRTAAAAAAAAAWRHEHIKPVSI